MTVNGVDHINIRTADLDRCKAFYCGVLGLKEGYRPPFDSPGAWLYAGGAPLVHVSTRSSKAKLSKSAIDHFAFAVKGFNKTVKRLEKAGIAFETFQVPDQPARQIFVKDPDGVSVELNFRDGT
jgi:catechol 2,3-dioxygenase-like lactoylglutathione lyase family enzyme